MTSPHTLGHLNDDDLMRRLHGLARKSHEVTAELLAHMAEVDRRKLYLARAKPSMYRYVVDVLGMSEYEAYFRIYAARAAHAYPIILDDVPFGKRGESCSCAPSSWSRRS